MNNAAEFKKLVDTNLECDDHILMDQQFHALVQRFGLALVLASLSRHLESEARHLRDLISNGGKGIAMEVLLDNYDLMTFAYPLIARAAHEVDLYAGKELLALAWQRKRSEE